MFPDLFIDIIFANETKITLIPIFFNPFQSALL